MITTLKRVAVVATLAVLGVFAFAVPAHAGWLPWCAAGNVCFAIDDYGNGAHFSDFGPVGTCQGMPAGFNDQVSSLWNRFQTSGALINLYQHNPCQRRKSFAENTVVPEFNFLINDQISAYCIGPIGGSTGCPVG